MVPLNPQPLPELRARYQAAVADVYDQADPRMFTENRPGLNPAHVFDFEDGLRLIVSRERTRRGTVGIHISASLLPGTPLHRKGQELTIESGPPWLRSLTIDRWAELTGTLTPSDVAEAQRAGEALFLGFTLPKGVPHWFIVLQHAGRRVH